MDSRILTSKVKDFALSQGADIVGIVGQKYFHNLPMVRPDELMRTAQSVVVIGIRRNIHTLSKEANWDMMEHYVGSLNMDMYVLLRVAHFIEDNGFTTIPISHHGYFTPRDEARRKATEQLTVAEDGSLQGQDQFRKVFYASLKAVSHMRLAEACGLGTLGRCKMIITPKFGPRIGLVSVITNAPLEPDRPLEDPVCLEDKCNLCVKKCPVDALDIDHPSLARCMLQTGGIPPLKWLRDKETKNINRYFLSMRKSVFPFEEAEVMENVTDDNELHSPGCGLCVRICPVGL